MILLCSMVRDCGGLKYCITKNVLQASNIIMLTLLVLVMTHDLCQNAIVTCRSQRVTFSADLAHSQKFSLAKHSSNAVHRI